MIDDLFGCSKEDLRISRLIDDIIKKQVIYNKVGKNYLEDLIKRIQEHVPIVVQEQHIGSSSNFRFLIFNHLYKDTYLSIYPSFIFGIVYQEKFYIQLHIDNEVGSTKTIDLKEDLSFKELIDFLRSQVQYYGD